MVSLPSGLPPTHEKPSSKIAPAFAATSALSSVAAAVFCLSSRILTISITISGFASR